MSTEPTEEVRGGPDRRLLIGLGVVVAILALLLLWAVLRDGEGDPAAEPTASPTATPTEERSEVASEEPSPSPSPTPSPTPQEPTERADQPAENDVAAFVEANEPVDEFTTGDVDGDGVDEVVVARAQDGITRIVVGRWNGAAFQPIHSDEGGSADAVERVEIRDYNGVAGGEIVTEQTVGEEGRSISVWGKDGQDVARQEARGGCWDGFHTYGVNGASIEPDRISATCDASALPGEVQVRDIYRWRRNQWTYTTTSTTAED